MSGLPLRISTYVEGSTSNIGSDCDRSVWTFGKLFRRIRKRDPSSRNCKCLGLTGSSL